MKQCQIGGLQARLPPSNKLSELFHLPLPQLPLINPQTRRLILEKQYTHYRQVEG